MKVFIIGNGGREHAIAEKISNSQSFYKGILYFTRPNAGMETLGHGVDIKPSDLNLLLKFAIEKGIDFTVVGPEQPLALGITDLFRSNGLKIFGPGSTAAMIESSKIFAKELMKEAGIPTADFRAFGKESFNEALNYIRHLSHPVVIKADGLAAGKGVVISESEPESLRYIDSLVNQKVHSIAGERFIVESFLRGEEISVFAVTDGLDYIVLPVAQDHKRIGENDIGPNTGGMGAYTPVSKVVTAELMRKIEDKIIRKTLESLNKSGIVYKGCLYCGLLIDENNNPYVIEFNCRFGDPETQAVLQLIESDFLQLLVASENEEIKNYELVCNSKSACNVVAVSGGYPGDYEKGKRISGLDETTGCKIFHAGTKLSGDGVVTNGGRVLSVTATEDSLHEAIKKAYNCIEKIKFEKMYFRKDIGKKGL
ncbi:phosphoribosylamine--glycine ligase [Ignavibacteria bacterium CHB1]|nr:MAG: phosphoribosylamine--glycine ligase [Chlorobiota bacterium]MBV6398554.1 Phosphoribosylamine--glycine ligase [Ignavibacteria bacterium]MCC6885788.1 phosphoribosylamine--glycine ligase [Ignavibacteriales bacterium]MCE7953017.1 phosphoribosylamine--glycine ligase [Chlorobi bacterium CHB7]MDL1887145.1 phosphoribosylamine--glycine ligase [Ignavibacteria bacterium CHB1]RIK49838.1 MAG: phosphoribosylamine--glycine ligase [Ignavibacteriota bacterium]